ncbi:hypothetical protein ACQ4PT_045593 [Festuca glaucescens]
MVAVAQLVPRATGYPWPECGGNKTFKANSKYQANLNHVAAMLPNKASASAKLFATAAAGVAPDRVWAMGLCRGDSDAASCFACLTQGFQDLPNDCSYDKEATIYYDACILHYSDARVLSAADTGLSADTYAQPFLVNITSDQARFNRIVADLMNATAEYAAYNSTRRFATGEADFDQEFPKVYSLAQCTPDQTPAQCRECLAGIIASTLADFFENDLAPRALWVNCNYRYEVGGLGVGGPFYNGPAMVRLASSPPAVPAPASAPAPAVHPEIEPPPPPTAGDPMHSGKAEDIEMVDSMQIDVSTLRAATVDFAESNKLGEGGFGAVYKGVLPNGDEIAVKRLSQNSTQGVEELKNELALVAKLKHKNLVRLVGVCLEQQERLLVYEFVPNRSLDLILFDAEQRELLGWGRRHKIINGIARGLQPRPSRTASSAPSQYSAQHYGYMAPEYAMRGNYSVKSDAFSFGVLVVEIVTGRKNNHSYASQKNGDLVTTVWEHWEAGTVTELVDPCMGGSFPVGDVLRCIQVGLLCVQGDPVARPIMSSVVMMLGSDTVSLQAPSKPVFFTRNAAACTTTAMSVLG